ncbi:MAG: hypothetical protein B7Y83_01255, partial [Flavobacteriales bacterium 32-34-25]
MTYEEVFTINITNVCELVASVSSQTNIACYGGSTGSATITVSGGSPSYTYSWSPSGGTAATAMGLTAGNYTCSVTDANGCTTTRLVTITQPPALVASVSSQTNIACYGGSTGSATITVSGGSPTYTYAWSPSGGTAATAAGLTAGNYTCTVTDTNGCTATQTVTITQPPSISISSSSQTNIACFGGSNGSASVGTPTGGAGSYTYS